MWEPTNVVEKKFNAETHKIIGEAKLKQYALFLDDFNENIRINKKKLKRRVALSVKPILLEGNVHENASILHLAHSDNKVLTKIVSTLGSICHEINLLNKEATTYFPCFIHYGDESGIGVENVKTVSKIIESVQKVHCFIIRCQQVIVLMFKQLCAILGKGFYVSTNTSSFPETLGCFSDLLLSLLTLDCVLESKILKDHWFLYRRSIRNMMHNFSKNDISREKIGQFDKHLAVLENDLLNGSIFRATLSKCMDEHLILSIKSSSINLEFVAYINLILSELEKDDEGVQYTKLWMQLNTLAVYYINIFGIDDKKLIKRILEINKKASTCVLVGNLLWYPEQFLLKHAPSLNKFVEEKAIGNIRLAQLAARSNSLSKETNILCSQVSLWIIEIDRLANFNISSLNVKLLQEISSLLIEGLRLAKKIINLIKYVTNLHADKGIPVTKSVVLGLCKLIEILKGIHSSFHKNGITLIYIILLISQQLSHKALNLLHGIRKNYTQEKSYKEHQLDVLSALNLCEHALKGPCTKRRFMVAHLALSASGLSLETLSEIRSTLNRLELISEINSLFDETCDCSFLYWHQVYILPVYFSKFFDTKADLSRHYLILNALTDCATTVGNRVLETTDLVLRTHLYTPLNEKVEENLRLQTHLHLQMPSSDPIQNYFQLDFSKFFPTTLKYRYKDIKKETEHYLSTMFYNLTTVILHDWKTYGEMRRLAYFQYGLETVDDNLPMQTLEQGLDVLEIMRNINVFVGKYLYNLNSQIFVEESSNNKHLNSISISHVANSIRTHGIGIMNTTINFTYQFLQKKFYIFSQFMFDEQIKSRLLKDLRFFNEHKAELKQMYPYERAEKFNVGIRKLGLNPNGQSYLDLFRIVITQIGNAMGYIRLIRSGGRRCLAEGTCFIPDLKEIENLSHTIKDEEVTELTKKSIMCLLHDLQSFVDNFEEATEYFKLLVKVFVPVFRDKNNLHLKNFYVIVPPLTINFIEHSLTSKEKLYKKNKADCAFSDDGFALGLAYVIELLNQESQLNSLHWFNSIQKKFRNDRLKIKHQKAIANNDEQKLQQTLALTEKRISMFERVNNSNMIKFLIERINEEFQLLYYSFSSARLFFQ